MGPLNITAAAGISPIAPAAVAPVLPHNVLQSMAYRYAAIDANHAGTPLRIQACRTIGRASLPGDVPAASHIDRATIEHLMGLSDNPRSAETNRELRALARYFDSCWVASLAQQHADHTQGWAKIRRIDVPVAAFQLMRMRQILRDIFFDTAPAGRPAKWTALSQAEKCDLNLAIGIAAVLRPAVAAPTQATKADKMDGRLCTALAQALSMRPSADYPASESAYRMAMSQVLRELDTQPDSHAFFSDRIALTPSDVLTFIKRVPAQKPTASTNVDYLIERRLDMAVLRYQKPLFYGDNEYAQPCTPMRILRMQFGKAMENEIRDIPILNAMFQTEDLKKIYHTGISFHNAKGKNLDALLLYLETEAPAGSAFAQLDRVQKRRLLRLRLYQLGEHPDYTIGSVQQSMASIMMRMSGRPVDNRYVNYQGKQHLLECWETRQKQWLTLRDYDISPDLYSAIHLAGANGVHHFSLGWYRKFWKNKILEPIANASAVREASHENRAALWRWLATRSPGWSAEHQRWRAITQEQYADSVEGAAQALYIVKQADNLPRYMLQDSFSGAGFVLYDRSLSELSPPIRQAISAIAKNFTSVMLDIEHVLIDDWLATSYRLLEYAYYSTALEMRPPPSYSVEVEAYLALLDHGITHEKMRDFGAHVYCSIPENFNNAYQERSRRVYDAFIDVIRNPHRQDKLALPNGKIIYPHAIIANSFNRYRDGLSANPWVLGRARQNLRDRGVPFFPALLQNEADAVAAPFRAKASKATVSGTELANHFFGSLPVTSPILHMSRAVRAGNYTHVPYYVLILTRDIMAAVALRGAIGAAYVTPAISTARYGSAALLAGMSAGTKRRAAFRTASVRHREMHPDKRRDVAFNSDQAQNIQGKIARKASQNQPRAITPRMKQKQISVPAAISASRRKTGPG